VRIHHGVPVREIVMIRHKWPLIAGTAFSLAALAPAPVQAAGDLLVAPTRVVLDGARGTEVIINNIGSETATYRVTLVARRMNPDGSLEEIAEDQVNEREAKTLSMISYAPRRVVLAPNQPQSVRVSVRPPEDLADGEYRVHMLIRAIPDAKPVEDTNKPASGLTVQITPIYGITIPVIVRKGDLSAQVTMGDAEITQTPDGPALKVHMKRTGTKSTYGRIRVTRPGVSDPLYEARGLAIYAETAERDVILPSRPSLPKSSKARPPSSIWKMTPPITG
jgi:P pilus assembly chaperone PapD